MIIKSPIQQLSCEHASAPIMHPLKIKDGSNMVGDLSSDALTHVHGNHLMGVKSSIQQLPYMHMSAPNRSSFEFEDACDMGGDIMHSRTFPQEHAKYYMTSKSPIQQLSHVQTSAPHMCPREIKDDGRTHSLPHVKYGPYTCPRCKKVFSISQTFAAHMLSHYKHESSDQKKKRLAAKYKRKNLRLVHQHGGITMLPMSSRNKMKPHMKDDMVDIVVPIKIQEEQKDLEATTSNVHVNSMIKEEPITI